MRSFDTSAGKERQKLIENQSIKKNQQYKNEESRNANGIEKISKEQSAQINKFKATSKIYCWGSIINTSKPRQNRSSSKRKHTRSSSKSKSVRYDDKELHDTNEDQDLLEISDLNRLYKFKKNAIVNVSCGKNHVALISKKGELYMMGQNDSGQLGIESLNGEPQHIYEEPVQISSLYYKGLVVDQVTCGFSHTLAVSKNGKVFSWGYGKFGALGHQNFESKSIPIEISYFTSAYQSSSEIIQIQAGAHHSGLLDIHGDLYMWGAGEIGQLGTSSRINENKPTQIRKITQEGEKIQDISLGNYHTLILTDMGRVLQTGICSKQLKQENQSDFQTTFGIVKCLETYKGIKSIKAKDFSVALNEYGKLFIWSDVYHVDSIGGGIDDMARISFGEQAQFNQMYIHDYELCADFILIRSNSDFYTYQFATKKLSRFNDKQENSVNINELSILSCGHNYIVGIKTNINESLSMNKSKSQASISSSNAKSLQKSSKRSSRHVQKYNQSQLRYDINHLKSQQQILDDNLRYQRHQYSEHEISDTIVHNQSYNGGRASTHIRKLSSSNNHTRNGSRGEGLLSNFSYENSGSNNLTILNSNHKLQEKAANFSNENSRFEFNNLNDKELRNFGVLNKNQIRSVIYDEIFENESITSQENLSHRRLSHVHIDKKIEQRRQSQNHESNGQNSQNLSLMKQINLLNNSKHQVQSIDELRCNPISSSEISPKIKHNRAKDQLELKYDKDSKILSHRDQNSKVSNPVLDNQQFMKQNYQVQLENLQQKQGPLSERKIGNKDKFKEAMKQEIKHRLEIEQQLKSLQNEFDHFKNEVGVEQMRKVLQESQEEYQKLYDICIQECEKSNKVQELYKKEKNLREQRENQIIDLGDQEEMLKNQIRHLEDQLNFLRDQQDTEQQSLKQTVLDQQKVIEELRILVKNDKDNSKEKIFDLEEMNIQLRNEIQQITEQFQGQNMIEMQKNLTLQNQNQDLKLMISQLQKQISILEQENKSIQESLNKERQLQQNESNKLQNSLQSKQNIINEYDQIFANMKEQEQEMRKQIESLQYQVALSNDNQKYDPEQQHLNNSILVTKEDLPQNLNTKQPVTPLSQQSKFQKQVRNSSQGKATNFIIKKPVGSQTSRIVEQVTSNNQKTNQGLVQHKASSQINRQSIVQKSQLKVKENQNQIENSQMSKLKKDTPEKLQQVINLTEINPHSLINDLNKSALNQDLQQQQHDSYKYNQSPLNIVTNSAQSKQNQTQMRKQRSNSPIDYLGLKPKTQSSFAPRLGSQTSRNKLQQNLIQSKTQPSNIQPLQQQMISPKIIGRYAIDEADMGTPSQYSLNITPTVQSSRGQQNDHAQINLNLSTTHLFLQNQLNQSMFDQQVDQQQDYLSGSNSTKGASNLSKSFDGGNSKNSILKKQVKFLVEQSNHSTNSHLQEQLESQSNYNHDSNKNLQPLNKISNIQKEQEIELLYETLANEMKILKGLNNHQALIQGSVQSVQNQEKNLTNLPLSVSHNNNYSFSQKDNLNVSQNQSIVNTSQNNASGSSVDNLKGKLEQIRKNKTILEEKIKQYEKKLAK
eukprot:403352819